MALKTPISTHQEWKIAGLKKKKDPSSIDEPIYNKNIQDVIVS